MQITFFIASLGSYARSILNELMTVFNQMNSLQWGIVSACAVAFGFLCLKGTGVNR
ncbi:hypothetical protein [Stieleria marina]|uniref:Uncharacterized protein n=1 Tax=Stieleria marina TaxID=1930275 RepID=A0A517P288_9BACT|nr:hypothetical protein K239x_55090 [Planctomycetes bacterium K23_9]